MTTLKNLVFRALRSLLKSAGIDSVFRYASKRTSNPDSVAVRSKFGFWYIGNIFDTADSAYGILQNGCVEESEGKAFTSLLHALMETKKDATVYDLGAHTGYYSLLAASEIRKNDSEPRIVAFEPMPAYAETIRKSVALNRLESAIRVVEIGISDKRADQTFYLAGSGSTLDQKVAQEASSTITIKTDRLDDIIATQHLPIPSILKIDIEGHEMEAIDGMKGLLNAQKPVLFLEIIKKSGKFENQRFFATFERVISMGYRAYMTETSGSILRLREIGDLKQEKFPNVDMYTFIPSDNPEFASRANVILQTL